MVYNVSMFTIIGECIKNKTGTTLEGKEDMIFIVFFIALAVIVGGLLLLRRAVMYTPSKWKRPTGNKGAIISAVVSFVLVLVVLIILIFWNDLLSDPLNC